MINQIISETISLINDLIYHIHQLEDEEYILKLKEFSNSTIGEHIRHIFNFYECILNGIKTGTVNYDIRIRDKKIETEKDYAILRFQEMIEILPSLKSFDSKKINFIQNENEIETNLLRELIYSNEHLIHHSAILRIYFQINFPDKKISKNFGFNKSTLNYNETLSFLSLK